MLKIYGIKNCDTMKKAFDWLDANKIPYEFHNYKTEGIDKEKISNWLKSAPANVVANTKGTTWKNLSDSEKEALNDVEKLANILSNNSSALKRPIVELNSTILIGFDATKWQEVLRF